MVNLFYRLSNYSFMWCAVGGKWDRISMFQMMWHFSLLNCQQPETHRIRQANSHWSRQNKIVLPCVINLTFTWDMSQESDTVLPITYQILWGRSEDNYESSVKWNRYITDDMTLNRFLNLNCPHRISKAIFHASGANVAYLKSEKTFLPNDGYPKWSYIRFFIATVVTCSGLTNSASSNVAFFCKKNALVIHYSRQ